MYYFFAPVIGWIIAGVIKYLINYIRHGKEAKRLIGNGGFPSNHTTTVTSVTALIGFQEGLSSPVFGLGIAVILIVIFDATGLRKYVGQHAESINKFIKDTGVRHRERVGHTKFEVIGGLTVGTGVGYILHLLM
ncbi:MULTISPECIES: divergent PAP2 family protein [Cohnella]|uniref:divergent PAP2 family protein n=1 Tax=Cohnella TaxID=329857 RepID=UPI0009BAFE69|nr:MULTISPECIES: divergent PAP2 family protein [Cohnella]MBN2980670.1 divergent PAP2 family protein [Cohnella algarum]